MYLFVLKIFLYSLVMRIVLLLVFLIFSFPIIAYSWEKVPVPDYVNKKTKSPWNFYENFESKRFKKLKINNKGSGKKPFKFGQDNNGNTFLAITVKDKSNKDMGSSGVTERAEIGTGYKNTKNKEVWYGFKVRFPKDFTHIDDRLLITQFKNQFKGMKKSPLLGIRFYQNGKVLDIGGDTGGNPTKWYNKKEYKKHGIRTKYLKNNDSWILFEEKKRGSDHMKILKGNKKFSSNQLGEWIVFKIGLKNSKKKDGFVKVFRNNELIMNYSGITYDWKGGQYKGTDIRIGPYRDSDPNGEGYPDQTIHFDDFIVVSDKKTLDKYLD